MTEEGERAWGEACDMSNGKQISRGGESFVFIFGKRDEAIAESRDSERSLGVKREA